MDRINPGKWGIAQKWYFLFTRSYWCSTVSDIPNWPDDENTFVEPVPVDAHIAFRFEQVTKIFGTGSKRFIALNKISFAALDGEITVLLGPNGAGKTTIMNILTGLVPADCGRAYIGDFDIAENGESARKYFGLCPQYDIEIYELTVREHFQLFAQLKGFTNMEANTEIETISHQVQLFEKLENRVCCLSGGMKRKLSLGIAICGGSKKLILDEPTSGIDVRSRREFWSILEKYKKSHTVLLSTHYMDEAEYLADRTIILSNGTVKCSGRTDFLKSKYRTGYKLSMSISAVEKLQELVNCIQKILPEAQPDAMSGTEVSLHLPPESSKLFPKLFRQFDQKRWIKNYSVTISTMGDIFQKTVRDIQQNTKSSENSLLELAQHRELLNGFALLQQQFYGSFIKSTIHASRNWKVISMQLILPALMTIVAAVQLYAVPKIGVQYILDLSLKSYGTNVTSVFTSSDGSGHEFVNAIAAESNMLNITDSHNTTEWILKHINATDFNENYILAMDIATNGDTKNINTSYNGEAYHSIASAVLYSDRTLARVFFPDSNLSIYTRNHPLPPTVEQSVGRNLSLSTQANIVVFNILIGLMVMYSAFTMLPVRERVSGVSTMLRCCGAPRWIYWISQYACDLLNALPSIVLVILVLAAFQESEHIYLYNGCLDAVFVLLVIFTFAQLPFGYCCSFLYDTPAGALAYCTVINIVLGVVTLVNVSILELPMMGMEDTAKILGYVFCIFPQYNLARGLFVLYFNSNAQIICTESDAAEELCNYGNVTYVTDLYALSADNGIGYHLLALGILCPVLLQILLFVEYTSKSWFPTSCTLNYNSIADTNEENNNSIFTDIDVIVSGRN